MMDTEGAAQSKLPLNLEMWNSINQTATDYTKGCIYRTSLIGLLMTNAAKDLKEVSSVLSSLSLPTAEESVPVTRENLCEAVASEYQKAIDYSDETIEHNILSIEKIESQLRLEKLFSVLFIEGSRYCCPELVSYFEDENTGEKSACVRVNGKYAVGVAVGSAKDTFKFKDKTYPLISQDGLFITGVELSSNNENELIIEHVNYAKVGGEDVVRMYRDDISPAGLVPLPGDDILSEESVNDIKECSDIFDIKLLQDGLFVIDFKNFPRLQEALAMGPDTTTREAADNLLNEKSPYTKDMRAELYRCDGVSQPLKVKKSPPRQYQEKGNPILEGLRDCVEEDRQRAICGFPLDVQAAVVKAFSGEGPKQLPNILSRSKRVISRCFKTELDRKVAVCLLEEEELCTRYANFITKNILASTAFLGGLGVEKDIQDQKDSIEGMRGDYGGDEYRHCAVECLRREKLAGSIRNWMCTEYTAKMSASTSRIIKSKHLASSRNKQTTKRPAPEKQNSSKKLKSDTASVPAVEDEEEEEEEKVIFRATVLPPTLLNEPKEASSAVAMTDMIAKYASVFARHISESPNGNIRLASFVALSDTFKKYFSVRATRKSDCAAVIEPVALDAGKKMARDVCETIYEKSESVLVEGGDVSIKRLLERSHIGPLLQFENDEELKLANRMKGILNVRRSKEERNAYQHLVEIMFLENIAGILSGDGQRTSSHLTAAVLWYIRVVIRNRICENYNLSGKKEDFLRELVNQVNNALDWIIKFNVDPCYLFDGNILSGAVEASRTTCTRGSRHYALLRIGEEKNFPLAATKMTSTSGLRAVKVFKNKNKDTEPEYMLCVSNYDTGNLFMLSMKYMRVGKIPSDFVLEDPRNRWKKNGTMTHTFPVSQLEKEANCQPVVKEMLSGNKTDEPERNKPQPRPILKKTLSEKDKQIGEQPLMFVCKHKTVWKNATLFNLPENEFYLSLESDKRTKVLPPLCEQALSEERPCRSIQSIRDLLIKYTTFEGDGNQLKDINTLSKVNLVIRRKGGDEELCKLKGENICTARTDKTMAAVLEVYQLDNIKNAANLKRFITTGTLALSRQKQQQPSSAASGEKNEKNVIPKMPYTSIWTKDSVCNSNLSPFLSKLSSVVRNIQTMREKCVKKKAKLIKGERK